MQALGPGALGQIFDDAARHAAGATERVDELPRRKTERGADPGGRRHGAEHRGWMEAGAVHRFGGHEAQPAQELDADRDADERRGTLRAMPLAGGEHRRHDDGAGVHRAAFERVVEILAMRRGAVDEGDAGRAQTPAMADRRARAVVVPAGERALDVIGRPRGNAQPDHVDQEILAFVAHRRRKARGIERSDAVGDLLGDGTSRKRRFHRDLSYCAGADRRRNRAPG